MLIGEDFDKIEFQFMGLDMLEPNAFIGDTLIFLFALLFAYKTSKLGRNESFFSYWKWFFIVFGLGFFFGGFGHLLYIYWGIPGKTPSWYLGIISAYFIERAMLSVHHNEKFKALFTKLIGVKLVLALIAALCVSIFVDLEADYTVGMKVPTINSAIGAFFAFGYLGISYIKKSSSFNYFWMGLLILIPVAIIQSLKINLHQWFDKNDLSHLLLIVNMLFYYAGIKGYAKHLENKGNISA